jgi:hypothetical protein
LIIKKKKGKTPWSGETPQIGEKTWRGVWYCSIGHLNLKPKCTIALEKTIMTERDRMNPNKKSIMIVIVL